MLKKIIIILLTSQHSFEQFIMAKRKILCLFLMQIYIFQSFKLHFHAFIWTDLHTQKNFSEKNLQQTNQHQHKQKQKHSELKIQKSENKHTKLILQNDFHLDDKY